MNYVCIGFGAVFVIAGILFALRKLLPRAWKDMPDGEKAKVNIKALCVNVGVMIMLCGAIVLVKGLVAAFSAKAFAIAMIVWFVASGVDVYYISKSERYRRG